MPNLADEKSAKKSLVSDTEPNFVGVRDLQRVGRDLPQHMPAYQLMSSTMKSVFGKFSCVRQVTHMIMMEDFMISNCLPQ